MALDHRMITYFTTESGHQAVQSDPNDSLGGFISSTECHRQYQVFATPVGEQVTATTSAAVFEVASLIGQDVEVGWWLTYHTAGANIQQMREIVAFDDGTGQVTLDAPLPATPTINDFIRVWPPNRLFRTITAAESSSFPSTGWHRCIGVLNQIDNTTGWKAWLNPVRPGPLRCDIAMGFGSLSALTGFDVLSIASEFDEPDLVTPSFISSRPGFSGDFSGGPNQRPQRFDDPRSSAGAIITPVPYDSTSWPNGSPRPIWIRMSLEGEVGDMALPQRCVWQLLISDTSGGKLGTMPLIADIAGPDQTIDARVDRVPVIGGGARLEVDIRDAATGRTVPDRTVRLSKTSGSGTLLAQNLDQTNTDGDVIRSSYIASTNPADAGDTIDFRVEVI